MAGRPVVNFSEMPIEHMINISSGFVDANIGDKLAWTDEGRLFRGGFSIYKAGKGQGTSRTVASYCWSFTEGEVCSSLACNWARTLRGRLSARQIEGNIDTLSKVIQSFQNLIETYKVDPREEIRENYRNAKFEIERILEEKIFFSITSLEEKAIMDFEKESINILRLDPLRADLMLYYINDTPIFYEDEEIYKRLYPDNVIEKDDLVSSQKTFKWANHYRLKIKSERSDILVGYSEGKENLNELKVKLIELGLKYYIRGDRQTTAKNYFLAYEALIDDESLEDVSVALELYYRLSREQKTALFNIRQEMQNEDLLERNVLPNERSRFLTEASLLEDPIIKREPSDELIQSDDDDESYFL